MVITRTSCERQVRETNNAIAFPFIARDSVVCYSVRREGNPARARIHTEIDGKNPGGG